MRKELDAFRSLVPYSICRVCVCALQQRSAFLSTTEPLTLHTDLLTALVTVSDNCCQSCCERTHLESRVCLCTPQGCHRQQHKQVGAFFFLNKSAEEEWISFLNLVSFNCMLWIGQFPKNLEANAEVVDRSQNSAV